MGLLAEPAYSPCLSFSYDKALSETYRWEFFDLENLIVFDDVYNCLKWFSREINFFWEDKSALKDPDQFVDADWDNVQHFSGICTVKLVCFRCMSLHNFNNFRVFIALITYLIWFLLGWHDPARSCLKTEYGKIPSWLDV